MASRKGSGPNDRRDDRGPQEIERFGRRLDNPLTPNHTAEQARRVVDELEANGAELHYRAGDGDLLPSFTYELPASGDRQRCRSLIAQAKAQPLLWSALLAEIARQSRAPA